MRLTITSAALFFSLLGCGGGGNSGDNENSTGGGDNNNGSEANFIEATTNLTGNYQYIGFVDIIQDDLEDRVNRDANFLQLTQLQDAAVFRNSVPMAIDSCKLSVTPTIPTNVGVIGFPDATFNLVSAGESFTLTSDAGTYATVTIAQSRFEIAPYPVPSPLTLDIPGAAFPAFNSVSIPTIVTVQNFQPRRNEALQADSTISWTPTGIENHTINLEVFDIVATDKVVDLRCHVADDGAFSLPTEIINTLNSSLGTGFALNGMQQDRRSNSMVIQGDALLVVSKSLQTL